MIIHNANAPFVRNKVLNAAQSKGLVSSGINTILEALLVLWTDVNNTKTLTILTSKEQERIASGNEHKGDLSLAMIVVYGLGNLLTLLGKCSDALVTDATRCFNIMGNLKLHMPVSKHTHETSAAAPLPDGPTPLTGCSSFLAEFANSIKLELEDCTSDDNNKELDVSADSEAKGEEFTSAHGESNEDSTGPKDDSDDDQSASGGPVIGIQAARYILANYGRHNAVGTVPVSLQVGKEPATISLLVMGSVFDPSRLQGDLRDPLVTSGDMSFSDLAVALKMLRQNVFLDETEDDDSDENDDSEEDTSEVAPPKKKRKSYPPSRTSPRLITTLCQLTTPPLKRLLYYSGLKYLGGKLQRNLSSTVVLVPTVRIRSKRTGKTLFVITHRTFGGWWLKKFMYPAFSYSLTRT